MYKHITYSVTIHTLHSCRTQTTLSGFANHTTNFASSINSTKQQPFKLRLMPCSDVPVIWVVDISPYKTTLIALLPFRYNPIIILPGIFQNCRLLLLTANGLISLEKFFTGLSSRLIHPVWWKIGVTGFEPTQSWSQIKSTTKLCYTPWILL